MGIASKAFGIALITSSVALCDRDTARSMESSGAMRDGAFGRTEAASAASTVPVGASGDGQAGSASVTATAGDDGGGGAWPNNEPPGMTTILAVDGSSKDFGRGFRYGSRWRDDSRVRVVSDPESRYGQAVEKRFFAGDNDGWNGFANWNNFGAAYQELYLRAVFKYSPNWEHHRAGQKLFYWGGAAIGSATWFYVLTRADGLVHFRNQGGGNAADKAVFRQVSGPRIQVGRYHTVEVLHRANSPGSADGWARVWVDGIEVSRWNKLGNSSQSDVPLINREWVGTQFNETRLTGVQSFLYWGGGTATKTRNDWVRISELYISGR